MRKLKNISNKKVVLITLCVMIVILILGFTYAYWTRTFTQTGVNINEYECFEIEFEENVEGISQTGGFPQTDEEGLKTPAYEVTIKNTCNTAASYNVVLHKLNTSTLDDSHLKVAVDNDIKLLINTDDTTNTLENATEAKIINTNAIAGNDSKTIKVRSWMDENTTEEEGSNKSFAYKITIEAVAGKNKLLSSYILANGIQTEIPNFAKGFPQIIEYKEKLDQDSSVNLFSNIEGNKALGDGYTFDNTTGKYVLNNIMTSQKYDKTAVNKYTCNNNTGTDCTTVYKINKVNENNATTNYTEKIEESQSVSLTSSDNKMVGTNYTFDESTGRYTLTNTTNSITYSSEYINYYTCNNSTGSGTTMYKIKVVNEGSITIADKYTRTANRHYVTKADISTAVKELTSGSGLYKTEDDDGPSYYFRGSVDNNYVSFANNLWKIVRINGDSSIRIIHTSGVWASAKTSYEEAKLVAFSYDNESACIKNSPCISRYNKDTNTFINNKNMINGETKNQLENWYINNISSYDDKIVLSNFCNDTSLGKDTGSYRWFGSYDRMQISQPSLKCSDTKETYGGLYKLKVGLITADELELAGVFSDYTADSSHIYYPDTTNYMYRQHPELTMTPMNNGYGNVYHFWDGTICLSGGYETMDASPVINLKSSVKVASGDGTRNNPYVIE